jgi:hypothetical protein
MRNVIILNLTIMTALPSISACGQIEPALSKDFIPSITQTQILYSKQDTTTAKIQCTIHIYVSQRTRELLGVV